jgi:hypothetical protein
MNETRNFQDVHRFVEELAILRVGLIIPIRISEGFTSTRVALAPICAEAENVRCLVEKVPHVVYGCGVIVRSDTAAYLICPHRRHEVENREQS